FFSSRRRHTRSKRDWSSDVCSSDLKRQILCHVCPTRTYVKSLTTTFNSLSCLNSLFNILLVSDSFTVDFVGLNWATVYLDTSPCCFIIRPMRRREICQPSFSNSTFIFL